MPTIHERFQDNLMASTKLDPATVARLQTAVTGPVSLPLTLTQIADSVSVNINNPGEDASYARPSVLAHLSAFAQNHSAVLKALDEDRTAPVGGHANYDALPSSVKTGFTEWQGMIAAIALSGVYSVSGLNLTVLTVSLNSANPLHRAILNELAKDQSMAPAVAAQNDSGTLFYVCQNGEPFAVFHPKLGLFPMTTYNGSAFAECIPWYDAQRGAENAREGWQAVVDWSNDTLMLDAFSMNRILWWCKEFGMGSYCTCLQSVMTAAGMAIAFPNNNIVIRNCFGVQQPMDNIWPGQGSSFGAVAAAYFNNGNPARIPNIFLNKLLIQYTADPANNKTVYVDSNGNNHSVCFNAGGLVPDFLREYAPVLPFNENILPLLDAIQEIRFDADWVNDSILSVRVNVSFLNSNGEVFSCSKIYDASQLRQTVLPYMMVWPYLDMPDDNSWKSYYATWASSARNMPMTLRNLQGDQIIPLSFDCFEFEEGVDSFELNRYATDDSWQLRQSSSPFRYAFQRCWNDATSERTGLIIFPKPGGGTPFQNLAPVVLGIDFGTTSTVCAFYNFKGHPMEEILPIKDYSACVTCMDESRKKMVDQQHWLGETPAAGAEYKKKFFSIVQLFSRNHRPDISQNVEAPSQQYYLDGRMFLASSFLIDFNRAFANNNDALSTQKITNDMKFSNRADAQNMHAASLFLSGIYIYAVLYLIEQRIIPNLTLLASYPNDVTKSNLIYSWSNAKQILSKMMDPKYLAGLGSITYYREATAAAQYYQNRMAAQAFANVLVSLDIGGGTTDLSISIPTHDGGEPPTFSLRYAGREIMVDTLIEYYRRWQGTNGFTTSQTAFASLWDMNEVENQNIVNNFKNLLSPDQDLTPDFLQRRLDNRTIRMDTEFLLAGGMNMGQTGQNPASNFLRELITLKFLMVMKLVSRFMAEHMNIWGLQENEEPTALGKLNFEMAVSGTSAQLLQYIFDAANLSQISQIDSASSDHSQPLMKIFCKLLAHELSKKLKLSAEEIQDVLNLRLYVDRDVAEKKEVCFGLLHLNPNQAQAGNAPAATTPSMTPQQRETEENKIRAKMQDMPIESFKDYIGNEDVGLIKLMQEYESAYTNALLAEVGMGNIQHVSELLSTVNSTNDFNLCRNIAAVKWCRYMAEDEQKPYLDLLMNTYVIDEYLNRALADIQAR